MAMQVTPWPTLFFTARRKESMGTYYVNFLVAKW